MRRIAFALIGLLALLVAGSPAAEADSPGGPPARGSDVRSALRIPDLPDHLPPAALRPEPSLPVPAGWPFPDAFPRTSGTFRLVEGALEWSDFLYDDHGATGTPVAPPVTPLAPTHGTYTYRPGAARGNGADIFRAGMGLEEEASYWRVDWSTLVDPDVPIAEFALDTDNSAATGGVAWAAGAGIGSPGIDRAIVLSSRGAWLIDPVTGARTALPSGLAVDRAARSFVLRVPRSTLEPSGTWKVRLAAGLANAAGGGFAPITAEEGALPGQPAVFNVAFRSHLQEPLVTRQPMSPPVPNFWREAAQAAALTVGDVSPLALDVRWDELAQHRTTPEPTPVGFSDRWYVSSIELGQGVVRDETDKGNGLVDVAPNYLGRVQPYGVYVPTTYDGRAPVPLTWVLHSLFQQHNAFGVLTPHFVQQACEARGSICVTPLGRGHDGFYHDEAELDFWEVWNRLAATYRLDPERTEIAGFSMGGYGAYKLGLAHPDLFAHATVLAGTPICGQRFAPAVEAHFGHGRCTTDGDTTPLLENARWLPYYVAHGTADELLPVTGTLTQIDEFDRLGYRYRFEHYLGQAHIPWYVQDAWSSAARHMGTGPRTVDPRPRHLPVVSQPRPARMGPPSHGRLLDHRRGCPPIGPRLRGPHRGKVPCPP